MKHHWRLLLLVVIVVIAASLYRQSSELVDVYAPTINPTEFTKVIDNPYLTLIPGWTRVFEAETEEGKERIEVTVTSDTKVVMGIEAVVVHDRVWLNDVLIEDTFDWYAQDAAGNVWYLGEATIAYAEDGTTSTKGSWEAGVNGAQPGVVMWADPQVGQVYRQEYFAGEAEDMGEVIALGESVTTALGSYEGCVKTRDYTPLEAQVDEYKWYCPATGGLTLEEGISSGERVELVRIYKE